MLHRDSDGYYLILRLWPMPVSIIIWLRRKRGDNR